MIGYSSTVPRLSCPCAVALPWPALRIPPTAPSAARLCPPWPRYRRRRGPGFQRQLPADALLTAPDTLDSGWSSGTRDSGGRPKPATGHSPLGNFFLLQTLTFSHNSHHPPSSLALPLSHLLSYCGSICLGLSVPTLLPHDNDTRHIHNGLCPPLRSSRGYAPRCPLDSHGCPRSRPQLHHLSSEYVSRLLKSPGTRPIRLGFGPHTRLSLAY